MAEIDKEELAKIVGHDETAEYLQEDRSIIKDKTQYSVRIPAKFAELAKIQPGKDKMHFCLVSEETEEGIRYTIQADLKRGTDEKV